MGASGGSGALDDLDREALEMPEVWQRMDALNADPAISETARMIRIEQVLAAGRMALQHKETRAAEGRLRVIERETSAGDRRIQLMEMAERGADRRAELALRDADGDGSPATEPLSDEEIARRIRHAEAAAEALRQQQAAKKTQRASGQ